MLKQMFMHHLQAWVFYYPPVFDRLPLKSGGALASLSHLFTMQI